MIFSFPSDFVARAPNWWAYGGTIIVIWVLGMLLYRMATKSKNPGKTYRPTFFKYVLAVVGGLLPAVSFWSLTGYFPLLFAVVLIGLITLSWLSWGLMIGFLAKGGDRAQRTSLHLAIDQGLQSHAKLKLVVLATVNLLAVAGFALTIWHMLSHPLDSPDALFLLALLVFTVPAIAGLLQQLGTLAVEMLSEDKSDHGRIAIFASLATGFMTSAWVAGYPLFTFHPEMITGNLVNAASAVAAMAIVFIVAVVTPFLIGRSNFKVQRNRVCMDMQRAYRRLEGATDAGVSTPAGARALEEASELVRKTFDDLTGGNPFHARLAVRRYLAPAVETASAGGQLDMSKLTPFETFLHMRFKDFPAGGEAPFGWDAIIEDKDGKLRELDYRFALMDTAGKLIDAEADTPSLIVASKDLEFEVERIQEEHRQIGRPLIITAISGLASLLLPFALSNYGDVVIDAVDGVITAEAGGEPPTQP